MRLWDAAKNKNHILESIEIPTKQVKIFYNQLKSQNQCKGHKTFNKQKHKTIFLKIK
jgi:hypothetical protein